MPIESQGIQIRRQSTTAGSTAVTSGVTMAATVSTVITRSDVGDFTADGFVAGMRIEFAGTTHNEGKVFTLTTSVAATAMGVYEAMSTHSTGIGTLTLTGHSFDAIGHITGFNGPSGSAAVIDVTSLDSTAKEKQIGIRDEGQLSLDINFHTSAASLHPVIRADRATRTRRIYDIVFTDESTAAGAQPSFMNLDAYVTGFQINGSVDNIVKGSVTLEITSAVKTQSPVG